LISYFCTGTNIIATDDVTIQNVCALLNTSSVDVVRVGTANLRVGKTDDGKIIYTDTNYNLLEKLTRLTFSDKSKRPNTISTATDDNVYYVGDFPSEDSTKTSVMLSETNDGLASFVKLLGIKLNEDIGLINFDSTSLYFEKPYSFYDTQLVDSTTSFLYADEILSADTSDGIVNVNEAFIIDDTSYIFIGDGTAANIEVFEEPRVTISSNDNTMDSKMFLANVIAKMPSSNIVTYDVKLDFSKFVLDSDGDTNVSPVSANLRDRLVTLNNKTLYLYDKSLSIDSMYLCDGETVYNYNDYPFTDKELAEFNRTTTEQIQDEDGAFVDQEVPVYKIVEINESLTDLIDIMMMLMNSESTKLTFSVDTARVYFNNSTIVFTNFDESPYTLSSIEEGGIYQVGFKEIEELSTSYSFCIDGNVYYCGKEEPTIYDEATTYTQLDKANLKFGDFCEALFDRLNSDMIIGYVNTRTILVKGDLSIKKSSNLSVVKTVLKQSETTKNSKFALVAKFPSTQKLFSYSFTRNTEIVDYDVFDLTWIYNQMSGSLSISFDGNAIDGYGNYLYYTRFNEGETENDFFHILQLNNFVTLDSEEKTDKYTDGAVFDVDVFGNELIMAEPTATNYATAIKKFIDYDDKQYSFIWDSGYCSPTLAKAMQVVALERNAQFVPSFPPEYRTVEDVLAYDSSLGFDSPECVKVVPGHKGTYCGNFLTTVSGSLSYIVARVGKFLNGTSEFQPLFGPKYGTMTAPNLIWTVNKTDQQKLLDSNINCIVNNINGTYMNFNLTSQKQTTYLSEEQNMYITNCIAHICEKYNPSIIAEQSEPSLWLNIINQLTQLIQDKTSSKKPTLAGFRVICDDKLNTLDVRESRTVKYKVQVKYNPTAAWVDAYVDVVRLNAF